MLLTSEVDNSTIRNMLISLLERPTFEEEFPDEYAKARIKGKWRIQAMDNLRGGIKFKDTLNEQAKIFWNGIC